MGVGHYLRYLCEEFPKSRGIVLRKTRRSLTESWMVTWEDHVLLPDDPMRGGARRNNRHSYDHPNGSSVVLGGMDEPMKMFSTEWDWAYVQEGNELALAEHEQINGTLRHGVIPWQQLITTCNPVAPSHWIYQRTLQGRMAHWVTKHFHNPAYYTIDADGNARLTEKGRAYLSVLSKMTGTRRKRLYEGLWVASEGQVYDQWNRDVHVRERAHEWKRIIVGVDDGYTDPFAVVRVCVDHDGRLHVDREHYQTGMATDAKVAAVRDLSKGADSIVVDSAAATLIADLRAAGLPAIGVEKNRVPSGADTKEKSWLITTINKVQDRLVVQGDGKPRLTVDPFCVNLCNEFEAYERRCVDGVYQEQPEDSDNHALDALRYVVDYVAPDTGPFTVGVVNPHQAIAAHRQAQAANNQDSGEKAESINGFYQRMRKDPNWGFN